MRKMKCVLAILGLLAVVAVSLAPNPHCLFQRTTFPSQFHRSGALTGSGSELYWKYKMPHCPPLPQSGRRAISAIAGIHCAPYLRPQCEGATQAVRDQ